LQITVKTVNNTARPNGLIPTLLVFGTYPCVNTDSPPILTILQRAEAIQKAMKALQKLSAERQVNGALHIQNGPVTAKILAMLL